MFNPILIEAHNPSPMTGRGNNTYLLTGAQHDAVLIDAGVGESRHLSEIREQLSREHAQLALVIVTHGHADHASGVTALAAEYHDVRFLKIPWPVEDQKYAVRWEPIADGGEIRAGSDVLRVLHTPGHSPDHLSVWHPPSGTVFTGDLVTQGSSVMIEASKGGHLGRYLSSLERILELEPKRLLPAHGPEITAPAAVLRQYLDHRLMRERQVIEALASGYDTVQSIAECIYDGLDPALMPAARENVRAHLAKLNEEARAFEDKGVWKSSRA